MDEESSIPLRHSSSWGQSANPSWLVKEGVWWASPFIPTQDNSRGPFPQKSLMKLRQCPTCPSGHSYSATLHFHSEALPNKISHLPISTWVFSGTQLGTLIHIYCLLGWFLFVSADIINPPSYNTSNWKATHQNVRSSQKRLWPFITFSSALGAVWGRKLSTLEHQGIM